jgi:hypothetical protein
MRVSNDPGRAGGPSGAFAEMFRLQAEFQSRLAEETLRYLRRLQGAVVPSAPGTVVVPVADSALEASGTPGATAELSLEIENLQRVHCLVTPQLTPLVGESGVTWFPAVESATASKLIAPSAVQEIRLGFTIPAELPLGVYRGALVLQGFRQNALTVEVHVGTDGKAQAGKTRRSRSGKRPVEGASPASTASAPSAKKRGPRKRRST